jgi:hypothetical protein
MQYLFSVCQQNDDGSVTIPAEKVVRWKLQMNADYYDLPEQMKESDRHQADKVLDVLQRAFAYMIREPKGPDLMKAQGE